MKFGYEVVFNPCPGCLGKLPGNGGCEFKERRDGTHVFYMDHPVLDAIPADERHATMTGGGRCGDLHERPVEAVREPPSLQELA